jgi:hypothetical protein
MVIAALGTQSSPKCSGHRQLLVPGAGRQVITSAQTKEAEDMEGGKLGRQLAVHR